MRDLIPTVRSFAMRDAILADLAVRLGSAA